jgi:hypothetical protein
VLQLLKRSALPASLPLSASWRCCSRYCVIVSSLKEACALLFAGAAAACTLLLRDNLLQLLRRVAAAGTDAVPAGAAAAAMLIPQVLQWPAQQPASVCCNLLGCILHCPQEGIRCGPASCCCTPVGSVLLQLQLLHVPWLPATCVSPPTTLTLQHTLTVHLAYCLAN